MGQEPNQRQTTDTNLRREVERLMAVVTSLRQQVAQLRAPDPAGGVVRPVEVVLRSSCIPMFKGKEDELLGGEWIARVESEIERMGLTGDREKINFALSHIHPEEGNARVIAQVNPSRCAWEDFKGAILAIFSQRTKFWDECLREAERYQDESFEEWLHSAKALRMNFTLLWVWPFPEDALFSITMRCLAATMVGSALDKYRVGDEWDVQKLKTLPYSQIIKDYKGWVEKNKEKDEQFQSTLRSRFEATTAVARGKRVPSTRAKRKNLAKIKCFFCEERGHIVQDCPQKKNYGTG
ncbi:uncharacterized protein [Penaeus vannamei]|uniref:uncharacterized protein n=1 Tax=Penaeus vannamei TaxID=6689 RepID=UPI00387FA76E